MRFTNDSIAIPCAVIVLTSAVSIAWGQQQQPQQQRPKAPASATPVAQAPAKGQPANPPAGKAQTGAQPLVGGQSNGRPPSGNTPVVPASGQVGSKPQRPAAETLVIEELPPELEELLQAWEAKSSKIKTLHGRHVRAKYNLVFEVETIAEGKFYLETPDKGRIDLVGIKPKKGEESQRLSPSSGKPFRLESDRSEKWICNGIAIFAVNEGEKTYEVVEIPKEHRGANIINSPLPFLFGMKAEDMKRRYRIELDERYKPKDKFAQLVVYPRQEIDQQNYSKARIILDKTSYLPTAVKLYDESAHLETVYQFKEVVVNDPGAKSFVPKIFQTTDPDPFNPNFKKEGYKLVLPQLTSDDQRPLPTDAIRQPTKIQTVSSSNGTPSNPRPNPTPPRVTAPK